LLSILKQYEDGLEEEKKTRLSTQGSSTNNSAKISRNKAIPPIPDKDKVKRERLAALAKKEGSYEFQLERPVSKLSQLDSKSIKQEKMQQQRILTKVQEGNYIYICLFLKNLN
jgi:hypothetical protein